MSVDKTTNYPTHPVTTGSAGSATSDALASLSEAFAAAFKTSLVGSVRGNLSDSALSEVTDAALQTASERRAELNRMEADRDRSEPPVSPADRKTSDRSEIRQDELKNEYAENRERMDTLQNDFNRRDQRRERFVSSVETVSGARGDSIPMSVTNSDVPVVPAAIFGVSTNPVVSSTPVSTLSPAANTLPMPNAAASPTTMSNSIVTAAVVVAAPVAIVPAQTVVPLPGSGAVPVSLQATASVLTIFTASGKLRDEREEEERRNGEIGRKKAEKNKGRKQGTAFFGEAVARSFGTVPQNGTARKNTGITEEEPITNDRLSAAAPHDRENQAALPDTKEENDLRPPFPAGETTEKEDERALAELLRLMQPVRPTETRVSPSEPPGPDSSERGLLLQRVVAACQSAVQRNGPVRVKLNLDRFGSLTLRMVSRKTDDGRHELSVYFETESESVARWLRESIDELRAALTERGVVLRELEIEDASRIRGRSLR